MENLRERLTKFRAGDYKEHQDLFANLKDHQQPHTLFITCSDSRIIPHWVTQALPGELFEIRSVANIIHPYQETENEQASAVASAIEYGVKALRVKNIIICGHSNCGGCAAIHAGDAHLQGMPATQKWLEYTGDVKTKVLARLNSQGKQEDLPYRALLTEQMNIVRQLENLLTYPYVAERVAQKELAITGMYYNIETGEVYLYNSSSEEFELAN